MENDDAAERCDDSVDKQRIWTFAAHECRRQEGKKHGDADAETDAEQIDAQ